MNKLKIFENAVFGAVRVVERDGEPWFVARDVALALGYADPADAIRRHCEKVNKIILQGETPGSANCPPVNLLLIPEEDVYALIFGSELPSAKAFRRWICDDVLPSIRKTGQYGGYNLPRVPRSFPEALRMIADIEEEKVLAIEQRDFYKRTKAEIGSRREATAMATASVAVRKVNALEDELGRGKRYKAVKAIPWLLEDFLPAKGMYSVVGKALKRLSADLGYAVEKIATPEFPDGVNAYHEDVIAAFRSELAHNPGMLDRYRKRDAA